MTSFESIFHELTESSLVHQEPRPGLPVKVHNIQAIVHLKHKETIYSSQKLFREKSVIQILRRQTVFFFLPDSLLNLIFLRPMYETKR